MTTRKLLKRTPLLMLILLLGGAVLLTACGTLQTTLASPAVECPECPEATCPEPVSFQDLWNSSAHADERAEAFTHWDEDEPPEVPTDCAKCHSRPGYLDFLGVDGTEADSVDHAAKTGTTITCFVCHNEATLETDHVVFPSGARISGLGPEATCMQCHQGRASTTSVEDAIAEAGLAEDDTPNEELGFVNSHAISAATPYGSAVHGAYEYSGMTYRGLFNRGDEFLTCIDCHDQHSLELQFEFCRDCHTSAKAEAREIRVDSTDYDGDGDINEGIAGEIETMHQALYAAIQDYARDVAGKAIVFDPNSHPYFFIDDDDDGEVDPQEVVDDNRYNAWTPRLLRAAYNLNYVSHDPGAYAHNSDYVLQAMYDSLVDIGGNMEGMARP